MRTKARKHFSYLICECGEHKSEHKNKPWPMYTGKNREVLHGCERTGCSVFSAARDCHNAEAYAKGESVPAWRRQGTLL